MCDEALERYEETLRRNRTWLQRLLNAERRREDNLHLLVAARLRVLLCDGSDGPALLDYARRIDRIEELTVWGPFDWMRGRGNPLRHIRWDPGDDWSSPSEGVTYQIEDYLTRMVGTILRRGTGDGINITPYTPRELIKWAANSEAVHHLPPSADKVKDLQRVRAFDGRIESDLVPDLIKEKWGEQDVAEALFSLGEWTVSAIDHLLDEPDEARE